MLQVAGDLMVGVDPVEVHEGWDTRFREISRMRCIRSRYSVGHPHFASGDTHQEICLIVTICKKVNLR